MKSKSIMLVVLLLLTSFFVVMPVHSDIQHLSTQKMILRPNANGHLNQWLPYLGLSTPGGTNWDNVNDVTPDGTATLVRDPSTNGLTDWYQVQNPSSMGTVSNVTLYAVIGKGGPGTGGIDFLINDSVNEKSSPRCSVTGTYSPWSPSTIHYTFELSPNGDAWTWSDVTNMEIGIRANSSGTFIMYGTQVYAEIAYLVAGTLVDDNANSSWYDAIHVHTIQEGVNNASSGDTVYIYNGTYNGGISVGKTLTIVGENTDNVIVNCKGSTGFTFSVPNINISSLTITNGTNGIYQSSNYATISNTLITENDVGVYLYHCNNNQILTNVFQLNGIHVKLDVADNNVITENTFENASSYGIYAHISDGNQINSNDFISNSVQAYDDGTTNSWDNGYWGNYWGDYVGADANYDGRGDTPVSISGGSDKDNYPLMLPWSGPIYVFVDLAYNSSTPGWGYTRFNTLIDGINAGAGGTCYVYPGTYPYILISHRINLVGDDKNTTIIDGGGSSNTIYFNPGTEHSTVSGFKIIGAGGGSGEGNAGIYALRDYSTVYNCIFDGDKTAMRITNDYITIHHCLFINNTYRSLRWDGGSNCIVHNCTFINNTAGVYIHFQSSNNVIVDNYFNSSHIALHIAYESDNNYFMRNLVIGQETAGIEINQMGDETSSSNNHIYFNNFYNVSNGGTGFLDWHTTPRANHYNNSTIGNFYDDYKQRYPSATNDSHVWNTPLALAVGAQEDYYPVVHPFNFSHSYSLPPTPPPSNESYAWDINGDGTVNYLDTSSLVSHYSQTGTPGWIPEDINDDGVVGYLDVSSLVTHYGETY